MSEQPDSNIPASEQLSQSERYLLLIRQGAEEAIAAHGAAGRTIPVSRDGKVVHVSAEELLSGFQPQATDS